MQQPNMSLVVLAYNEQEHLEAFVLETLSWLERHPGRHEVILVDDGSRDRTPEIAADLCRRDARVRVVTHENNRGMGAGMRSGILAATGDVFALMAADGQIAASSLDALLPELEHADMVLSVYSHRDDGQTRAALSAALRGLMKITLGLNFRLEGTYLIPVSLARKLLPAVTSDSFFFSFELIARALSQGSTAATVVIESRPRIHGESKVANLRQIRRVAAELMRFRLKLFREGTLRL